MRNRATSKLIGPLLVQPDQIRKLFGLVEEIRKTSPRADAYFGVGYRPVTVFLADEQQYTLDTIDDIFLIENRTANPIRKIRFDWPFDSERSVSVTITAEWFRGHAAEIELTGSTQQNMLSISEFKRILDTEPDIFIRAIRTPPWILSFVLVAFVHLLGGSLTKESLTVLISYYNTNFAAFLSYFLILWIMPITLTSAAVSGLINRYFGRAIFYWDGGVQRYQNRRLVLVFAFWTIPIAILSKFLIG